MTFLRKKGTYVIKNGSNDFAFQRMQKWNK